MAQAEKVSQIRNHTATIIVEFVPIADLKAAVFNPKSRVEKRAVSSLKMSIEKAGEIIVPLIITDENRVADGHRRLHCARELGYLTVPCIRKSGQRLSALWGRLNTGIMAPNSKTWMEAVRHGYEIEFLPEKEQARVIKLKRIMGEKGFQQLADNGRSTYILVMAEFVGRYVDNEADSYLKAIIVWFEKCQQQFAVRRAIADHCNPEIIRKAIGDQKPIRLQWVA